jgi:hypothetical protein
MGMTPLHGITMLAALLSSAVAAVKATASRTALRDGLLRQRAVASEAATRLMTSTFEIMKSDPQAGRADALRQAMLAYLNDTSNPWNAQPAFWGPFSLVGEGRAHYRRQVSERSVLFSGSSNPLTGYVR